ncbi:MAG: acetolactate synthase small subunit [Deltaproteobacteria bacterium]|mgnify:CR=1 FL=1|nr:Putative acetolactate synthase small subunit [bacterium HR37]GIW46290.1 MAG: acetolactate synthase small subunit [Deltaproteobacteria bacterium]
MRHTISILVDNEPGVLARIAGLFSARGFNIESLCVAETLDPTMSRITLVTSGDDWIIEQIIKRFNNMINVIKVQDLTEFTRVEREMVLVRVEATPETRAEILRTADIFRAKVVDVGPKTYMLELTGDQDKIDAFLEILKPLGIREIARTGTVALARELQNSNKRR